MVFFLTTAIKTKKPRLFIRVTQRVNSVLSSASLSATLFFFFGLPAPCVFPALNPSHTHRESLADFHVSIKV